MRQNLIARPPPPAFLFPIYNVKDLIDLPPTPLFSAGGRRRRLSSGRPPWCQSLVSEIFAPPSKTGFKRKEYRGLPRGFPHKSVAIRLRLGKLPIFARKSSTFRSPARSSGYCPERRRLLCPAACGVNRLRSASASMTRWLIPPRVLQKRIRSCDENALKLLISERDLAVRRFRLTHLALAPLASARVGAY
jgi:hypothetical protein